MSNDRFLSGNDWMYMDTGVPRACPCCGAKAEWKYVGTDNKGFSAGKAAVGIIALGPLGAAAGALGKKKSTYYCGRCGCSRSY